MKKEVLICDSSQALGKIISRRLMSMGLPSDCCKNTIDDMQSCLSAGSYRIAIVFAFRPDEKLLELIGTAKQHGTAVLAGIFAPSAAVFKRFLQAGALRCLPMPFPTGELCRIIVQNIGVSGSSSVQPDIFLEELGFPRRLRGFHYLCRATELCTLSPERIWNGMTALYEEIAAYFGTKPSLVERSLRNLAEHACVNGSVLRLTGGRYSGKLTNTELVCAVCDMLAKQRKTMENENKKL